MVAENFHYGRNLCVHLRIEDSVGAAHDGLLVVQRIPCKRNVRPEIQLVPTSEIVKLGPPHKIPRTAKS